MPKQKPPSPKNLGPGLTFDDVLLVPNYSEILPKEVNLETRFTKNIKLSIPLLSAAMDTVTEAKMAIGMAQLGGLGIIHKNLSIEKQVEEVLRVKRYESEKIFNPKATKDKFGRLRVGATLGTTLDTLKRASALVKAEVDVLCVDTAHGHSKKVLEIVKKIRTLYPKLDIIAGNIATGEAARALIKAGVNAVKVGIGPGSICTTRIVSGVGAPQLSAILEVSKVCIPHKIPVIADGGIKDSGDIVKALAFGADTVMIGSLLAGTDESPGETIIIGKQKFKKYRGMGSVDAMKAGSQDRYFQGDQTDSTKLVPEGVSGHVAYKGTLGDVMHQYLGGLRSGMGYLGAKDIQTMRQVSFYTITNAGLKESHVHDLYMIAPAPNYKERRGK